MKSKKYDIVKYFFDKNFWSLSRVADAVYKKWITEAEYKTITGKSYV